MDNSGMNMNNGQPPVGPPPLGQPFTGPQPMGPNGQMTGGSAPLFEQPPKQPVSPEKKKKIILFCCIGGGVLVLGIAALIILPMILSVNYEAAYKKAERVQEAVKAMGSNEACGGLDSSMASEYVSKDEYSKYVEKCTEAIVKFEKVVEELAKEGAVSRDSDIKKAWDEFKTVFDRAMPLMKEKSALLVACHDFMVNISEHSGYNELLNLSDSEIDNIVKPLMESGSTELSDFGKRFSTLVKKYASAYKTYMSASTAYYTNLDPNLKGAYDDAFDVYWDVKNEYEKYTDEYDDLGSFDTLFGVDSSSGEYDVGGKWTALYEAIRSKHFERSDKD